MRRITPSDLFRSPIHLLAFGFGTGMSPVAPGTLGTLAAVPIVWALSALPDSLSAVVVLVFTVAGVHICQVAADTLETHDHPGIVWDEMAGLMVTLLFVPFSWTALAVGVVLFRIFDIWKPWPIGYVDKKIHGGIGIMLDDLIAAVFAGLVLRGMLVYFGF